MTTTFLETLAVYHRTYPTAAHRYACPCGAGDYLTLTELAAHLIEAGAGQAPSEVADLREQLARAQGRIDREVDWQYQISARAKAAAVALSRRHDEQMRALRDRMDTWQQIGRRVEEARKAGRKTVRIADLLREAS